MKPVTPSGSPTVCAGAWSDERVPRPRVTRTELLAHGMFVEFRYLDQNDAWVPLGLPPVEGGYFSAVELVRVAVSEAQARGIECISTAVELAHPLARVVLDALRQRLGEDFETVDTRCAGSSVLVTARLRPTSPRAVTAHLS